MSNETAIGGQFDVEHVRQQDMMTKGQPLGALIGTVDPKWEEQQAARDEVAREYEAKQDVRYEAEQERLIRAGALEAALRSGETDAKQVVSAAILFYAFLKGGPLQDQNR